MRACKELLFESARHIPRLMHSSLLMSLSFLHSLCSALPSPHSTDSRPCHVPSFTHTSITHQTGRLKAHFSRHTLYHSMHPLPRTSLTPLHVLSSPRIRAMHEIYMHSHPFTNQPTLHLSHKIHHTYDHISTPHTLVCPYRCVPCSLLPKYHGSETRGALYSIRMANLTAGMSRPCVMDIKMGKRTFLESETTNMKRRHDLVKKVWRQLTMLLLHDTRMLPRLCR